MAKPNTNEALSSELDFASSYKTERPLRRNGLIDSAFVRKNNSSLNFAARISATLRTQPRHSRARGFPLNKLPATRPAHIHGDIYMKNGTKRRAWTFVQVRELKSLAREKVPARSIARRLKRTEEATRKKALRVGISLDSRA